MLSLRVTFHRMGGKSECCRKKKEETLSSAPACMLNLVWSVCLLSSLSFSVYLHMHYTQTSFSFQMVGAGPHLERNVKKTPTFCRT